MQLHKNHRLRQTLAQSFACSGPCRGEVSQLIKADQQLWLLASDEGLPSLKPAADGVKPLWRSFELIRVSPRTLFLCPLMWPKRAQLLSRRPRSSKVTKPSVKDKAPPRFKARGPRMPEELRPCHEAEVLLRIQSRSGVSHFGQSQAMHQEGARVCEVPQEESQLGQLPSQLTFGWTVWWR